MDVYDRIQTGDLMQAAAVVASFVYQHRDARRDAAAQAAAETATAPESQHRLTNEALRLARIIWDYHCLGQSPAPADAILALGTNDVRVAEYAAELYLRGFAPTLVCSGGVAHTDDLLATTWDGTEAEVFAEVAVARGVPRDRIVLETRALNTAENFRYTRRLIQPASIVIAVKPFMQRRVAATIAVEWPDIAYSMGSPRLTLDEYFTPELTPDKVINIMVGDLQRIWLYAERGWAAPQPVPPEVKAAFDRLVALGYDQHLTR